MQQMMYPVQYGSIRESVNKLSEHSYASSSISPNSDLNDAITMDVKKFAMSKVFMMISVLIIGLIVIVVQQKMNNVSYNPSSIVDVVIDASVITIIAENEYGTFTAPYP